MSAKFLYIPYKPSEFPFEVQEMAIELREKLRAEKLLIKTFQHGKKSEDLQKANEIYILGYGVSEPSIGISNVSKESHKFFLQLSIKALLERLIQDGFEPKNAITIHLCFVNITPAHKASFETGLESRCEVQTRDIQFKPRYTDFSSESKVNKLAFLPEKKPFMKEPQEDSSSFVLNPKSPVSMGI